MIGSTRAFSVCYRISCAALLLVGAGGCLHPLSRNVDQMLREQLLANNRAYLNAVEEAQDFQVRKPPSTVAKNLAKRMATLESISGPNANKSEQLDLGPNLHGTDKLKTVTMSLRQALRLAAQNNLDVRVNRLIPAISQTQVTRAMAVFDAIYFAQFQFQKLDTPQPPTVAGLDQFGSVKQDTRTFQTGIRKTLTTGGQISASTNLTRTDSSPSFFSSDRFYEADVTVALQQPLLRNFGSDVVRSNIILAANARDQSMADLMQSMLDTQLMTEQAYWDLVFARENLAIQQRLYRVTQSALDKIVKRKIFDASSMQVSQMRAFVAESYLQVVQAREAVFDGSDRLKALIYAPQLSLASEDIIVPLDMMVDAPITFNLRQAMMTALGKRPDMQRALSRISDATIRQRVADNQRLPVLDLSASVTFNGVNVDSGNRAYEQLGDGDFIDYILGLLFEMPIGNRGPEAAYQGRQLERRAQILNYQRTAQNVALEVKLALRALNTSYVSVGAARQARLASAETVRAVRIQVEFGTELTPTFLDFKNDKERELARNELNEVQAMVRYNVAVAAFYRTIGTLLEHNGIEFVQDE